ncbi:Rof/RNase P-like protein [Xylogone sp. PMI_703]|nr:Rof/RNase P-like protein [Xylogone sp. PMI_703]
MSTKDNNLTISLLSRAHSPESATRIFDEKIKQRPLHLKPTEGNTAQQYRRLQRQRKLLQRKKKLKPAPLSAHDKRALCIYDIPKEAQKYKIYEPLNKMWIGYILEVLGNNCTPVTSSTAAKLVSADYHGAMLEVVRSRCVGRVGIAGIVVKDSKFVFELITRNDELKIVPKEHTVFKFTIPSRIQDSITTGDTPDNPNKPVQQLVFELHGDQFIHRAADRANKKFKSHFLSDV